MVCSTATGRQSRSRDASLAAPCDGCMSWAWAGLGLALGSGSDLFCLFLFVRGRLDVGGRAHIRVSGKRLLIRHGHDKKRHAQEKKNIKQKPSQWQPCLLACLLFTRLRPDAVQSDVARPEFRLCSIAASQRKRRRS